MKPMPSISTTKPDVRIFKVILIILCLLSIPAGKAGEPVPAGKYKKIVVLAKIEQANLKKQFEEAVVGQLKAKGYEAVTSGSIFTNEELEDTETLEKKIEELGIDAALVYTIENFETKVTNTPTVRASVGVPVRIGFVHAYIGSSVPLGGGPQQDKIVHLIAGFYTDKTSTEPAYTIPLSGNLDKGPDALISDFSKKSIKALVKNDLL